MCGRTRCSLAREQVVQAAGVAPDQFIDGDKYSPVENMGPGRYAPVVFEARDSAKHTSGGSSQHTALRAMRWGLIPSFTKPDAKPDHFVMFNARSENLQERPAYKRLVQFKRCVVICDGYYEWKQLDKREKQPYYFYREGSVMKFAGLYDTWKSEGGEEMYSCTILTTAIAPELKWLHTRMPVILDDGGVARWLSDTKFESLKDLLVSYRGADLKYHPVDKRIGSTKFQSDDCAKKVDIKHAGNIKSFFGVKQEKHEHPPPGSHETDHDALAISIDEDKIKREASSMSSPVKLPASSANVAANPQRGEVKSQDAVTPRGVGFVTASSLLGKRRYEQERSAASTSKSPSKSPAKLKSSPKPKRHAVVNDPKQGSLLSFFKPENPK